MKSPANLDFLRSESAALFPIMRYRIKNIKNIFRRPNTIYDHRLYVTQFDPTYTGVLSVVALGVGGGFLVWENRKAEHRAQKRQDELMSYRNTKEEGTKNYRDEKKLLKRAPPAAAPTPAPAPTPTPAQAPASDSVSSSAIGQGFVYGAMVAATLVAGYFKDK